MRILDIAIVSLLLLVAYCYVLYPLVIKLLAKFFPKPSFIDESYRPTVSIVLAVYNEERVLQRCIESLLALDYPKELIEIVIGSDGSDDRTNEMLADISKKYSFIKPYLFSDRRGKMPVLNDLVTKTSGEILLFADADITLSPNTLATQIRHYTDKNIGAVAGAYRIHSDDKASLYSSEKEYASLEQNIRLNESIFSSTMGLFGGNYTIRRELWRSLPDPLVHDDLFVVLSTIDQGKRVLYEKESVSVDLYGRSLKDEFRRKSRSASRGYHTLSFFPHLSGFAGGENSFLLWSHKILRWLSPFMMSIIVLLSFIGLNIYSTHNGGQYILLLLGFMSIIFLTLLGWILEKQNIRVPIISQCTWFVIMNIAYVVGTFKFLMNTDEGMWSQATRPVLANPPYSVKEAGHIK